VEVPRWRIRRVVARCALRGHESGRRVGHFQPPTLGHLQPSPTPSHSDAYEAGLLEREITAELGNEPQTVPGVAISSLRTWEWRPELYRFARRLAANLPI
jgi:hypothetical protein